MTKERKRLIIIILIPAIILFIPVIAMQINEEVKWTLMDFVVAAALLFGTGLILEIGFRKLNKNRYRIILLITILTVLMLTWLELAVGIFGTPFAGS